MAKMFFAKQKDTGKIVSVDEVEKGLACNCICPHCGATLEAKKGKVNVHHFAHYDKDDTSFCSESALHLAAKEVLKEERKIMLPSLRVGHNHFEVLPDKYIFRYNSIDVEKSVSVDGEIIRPDVIVYNENAKLAIEILVSHAVDDEKKEKIKRAKLTTVEISLDIDDILNKETLRIFLISKISNKKWIFSNQKVYFEAKIPQLCKKIMASDSYIKSCPLKVWQEKQFVSSIHECHNCKYGFDVNSDYVLCLGDKRISNAEDFNLYTKNFKEHINNRLMKELEEDKKFFARGLCPVCNSQLRVYNADDPYVCCSNYEVCKFTARIDLNQNFTRFKNRKGIKTDVEIPLFVLSGIAVLEERVRQEFENIETYFPMGYCPYCLDELVIRKGKYGVFLGCRGYLNTLPPCNFKAKLNFKNMTAMFQARHSSKKTIKKSIPIKTLREYEKYSGNSPNYFVENNKKESDK